MQQVDTKDLDTLLDELEKLILEDDENSESNGKPLSSDDIPVEESLLDTKKASLDQSLEKEYSIPCSVGEHRHQGMSYCHPVSQHHHFEHRSVGAGTSKNEEYTVPVPGSPEALKERTEKYKLMYDRMKREVESRGEEFSPSMTPEEEAKKDEDEGAGYNELSSVTVGALSRQYGIDEKGLMENLQKLYGKRKLEEQIVSEDAFTGEGHPIKYKVLKLTPSQVYVAHEIAAQIRRASLSRSKMPHKVKLQSVLNNMEKMIETWGSRDREEFISWMNNLNKEEITGEMFPESPKSIVLDPEMAVKTSKENDFPDPYSPEVYSWIDNQLTLGGVSIGGNHPRGSKIIGKNIEQHLYGTLQDAVDDYLKSLTGSETQTEAIEEIRSIIDIWSKENLPIADKAFEELFKRGFSAGVISASGKLGTSDEIAMKILKDGKYRIGNRITLFGDSAIKDFSDVITQSYTPEGKFELDSMIKDMNTLVPSKRYELERIARTETAQVSNLGRIWSWDQDPERFNYQYFWNFVPDNRVKEISRIRSLGNPYDADGIKFLWLHQEQQLSNGKWQSDVFNQRCSVSRSPVDEEFRQPDRFNGEETMYRKTVDVAF